MVQKALTKGMVILHQFIPHYNIEKEIFVRLNPCRNCFAYDHKLEDCTQEKKMRCTFCGGGHKQAECNAVAPKCINCGGEHRTLAAACKIRKELIKRRSKEIRERSKSRSRQEGGQGFAGAFGYADAVRTGPSDGGRKQETTTPLTKDETKNMLTVIMSAIVYGQYMEALEPGSFQRNVNEVYKLNGPREVKFSPPAMTSTVEEACREVFRERTKKDYRTTAEEDRTTTLSSSEPNLEMDISDDAIEREEREIDTMIKRSRESLTPPAREDKRKKQEKASGAEAAKKPPQPQRQSTEQVPGPESGAVTKTRTEAEEGTRETEEEREQRKAAVQPRSRTSSTSSEKSLPGNITKQVGITVYVRKTSNLNITSRDPRKREEVRRAITKGDAKITWKNPKAERQSLIQAFSKNKIDMEEIEYRRIDNGAFEKLNSVCTSIYGVQI